MRKKVSTVQLSAEASKELNELLEMRRARIPINTVTRGSIVAWLVRKELKTERRRVNK